MSAGDYNAETFAEQYGIKTESKVAPPPTRPRCPRCQSVFDTLYDLNFHQYKACHWKCVSCGLDYDSEGALMTHNEKVHSEEQNLVCPGCGDVFTRAGGLMAHVELQVCKVITPEMLLQRTKKNAEFTEGLRKLNPANDPAADMANLSLTENARPHWKPDDHNQVHIREIAREVAAYSHGDAKQPDFLSGGDPGAMSLASQQQTLEPKKPPPPHLRGSHPVGISYAAAAAAASQPSETNPRNQASAEAVPPRLRGSGSGKSVPQQRWDPDVEKSLPPHLRKSRPLSAVAAWQAAAAATNSVASDLRGTPIRANNTLEDSASASHLSDVKAAQAIPPHLWGAHKDTDVPGSRGNAWRQRKNVCPNPLEASESPQLVQGRANFFPPPAHYDAPKAIPPRPRSATATPPSLRLGQPRAARAPAQPSLDQVRWFPDPKTPFIASNGRIRIIDPDMLGFNSAVFYNSLLQKFKCPYVECYAGFKKASGLVAHLKSPAHRSRVGRITCPTCLNHFNTLTAAVQHCETATITCNIRETAQFRPFISQVTGGMIDGLNEPKLRHADGTPRFVVSKAFIASMRQSEPETSTPSPANRSAGDSASWSARPAPLGAWPSEPNTSPGAPDARDPGYW